MLSDHARKFSLKGEILYRLYDQDGQLKIMGHTANLITNDGVSTIVGPSLGQFTVVGTADAGAQYIAVGTGSGTISVGSHTLGTEIDRISSTFSQPAFNQWQEVSTFGTGRAVGAVTEAGNFNSSASNAVTMFAGQNFAVVNKLSADTLQITWTFTVSGS